MVEHEKNTLPVEHIYELSDFRHISLTSHTFFQFNMILVRSGGSEILQESSPFGFGS